MIVASVKSKNPRNRNGDIIVVSKDHKTAVKVDPTIAVTVVEALENWKTVQPKLEELYQALNKGTAAGSFALNLKECIAPITNAPGFFDGSAYLSHVVRARRARGDQMPESAKVTPLMYQGVADNQLPWNAPLDLMDVANGGDFEGEFAAVTLDIPKGTSSENCGKYIAFFTMFNDITYREIVKQEIETKFGFLQSKPNSSFAPFLVTPDELGSAWDGKRITLDMQVTLNGKLFGKPNGREMHFSFGDLIAHAGRTRPLSAGTIVGTGTISNESTAAGFACLTEKRFQEIIDTGKPTTPWLQVGDHLIIDVEQNGKSVFGSVDQTVTILGR